MGATGAEQAGGVRLGHHCVKGGVTQQVVLQALGTAAIGQVAIQQQHPLAALGQRQSQVAGSEGDTLAHGGGGNQQHLTLPHLLLGIQGGTAQALDKALAGLVVGDGQIHGVRRTAALGHHQRHTAQADGVQTALDLVLPPHGIAGEGVEHQQQRAQHHADESAGGGGGGAGVGVVGLGGNLGQVDDIQGVTPDDVLGHVGVVIHHRQQDVIGVLGIRAGDGEGE